ncbi:hypothetical protein [Nocardioides sp. GXQ0305]|uniref:hypothetical protein n=1 Tax=Nocardioides sp. GXQ0305 TaxID=3423912 RepID=UPI003D7D37AF
MPDPDNPKPDTFDRLLDAMPRIAEAVNAFGSEKNQRAALDALIRAIGVPDETGSADEKANPVLRGLPTLQEPSAPAAKDEDHEESDDDNSPKQAKRRKGKNGKKSYNVPKNLNFAPSGQPSLYEFIEEKKPRTNDEKSLLACYYLSEMMGFQDVTVERILAVYIAADWSPPAHPDSSLRGAAHRTGWIDTANTDSIKVTWKGETHIKSKMPGEKKSAG